MGAPDDPAASRVQSERAVRLIELLGLTEDELCAVLGVDPLTLLSGQLDHRPELPILLDLLAEAEERAGPARAASLGAGRRSRAAARSTRSWAGTSPPSRTRWASCRAGLRAARRRRRRGGLSRSSTALRVRYAECDLQGVLFNANYLAYIDHTITELWRAAYGGYTVMLDRGVDIVVAEANLRFLGSARFDEEITIEATVTHLGTTSVTTALPLPARRHGRAAARGRDPARVHRPGHAPRRRCPTGRARASRPGTLTR